MSINTGGPAFPSSEPCANPEYFPGMTLRDYFASHCLLPLDGNLSWEGEAAIRYKYADAMIAERSKP